MVAAPSASAWTYSLSTGTSRPYGGWGEATIDFGNSSIEACDLGGKDGLRAVAMVSWTGMVDSPIEAQDTNGSNGYERCSGDLTFWGPETGTAYTFKACLRDGATGTPQLCSTHKGSWGYN
ncbi:hypothetical protein GA0115254_100724 [Streptomyces sp. Ncost-T10-10d]|nr:hypothetical protein GA0115254_100724 [Streptomyces sp. Ncost-T10-10d]